MSKPDILKTPEELAGDLFELHEQLAQPYLTEERKAQIRLKIGHVSFELGCQNIPMLEASE